MQSFDSTTTKSDQDSWSTHDVTHLHHTSPSQEHLFETTMNEQKKDVGRFHVQYETPAESHISPIQEHYDANIGVAQQVFLYTSPKLVTVETKSLPRTIKDNGVSTTIVYEEDKKDNNTPETNVSIIKQRSEPVGEKPLLCLDVSKENEITCSAELAIIKNVISTTPDKHMYSVTSSTISNTISSVSSVSSVSFTPNHSNNAKRDERRLEGQYLI